MVQQSISFGAMNHACVGLLTACQLILQKDLYIKSSTVNIYVYDCHINHIYIYIYIYQLTNNQRYGNEVYQ